MPHSEEVPVPEFKSFPNLTDVECVLLNVSCDLDQSEDDPDFDDQDLLFD